MNLFKKIQELFKQTIPKQEEPHRKITISHRGDNVTIPVFTTMGLRLKYENHACGESLVYYRDGGNWSVDFKVVNGEVITQTNIKHLNNLKLNSISEETWRKDNGQYAPLSSTVDKGLLPDEEGYW